MGVSENRIKSLLGIKIAFSHFPLNSKMLEKIVKQKATFLERGFLF
jgi:hypothetical protein